MRKFLIAGTAALAFGAAGAVIAAEGPGAPSVDSARVSSDSLRKDLESMGYRVVRIATEHGAYKARAIDTETGTALKLTYSAASGELLRAKLHDERD